MLTTKLLILNTTSAYGKKMQSKLDQCCAILVQPHVVCCSACKAVDNTYFVRNLTSVAHQDHYSIMTDWQCRDHRFAKCTWNSKCFLAVPPPIVRKPFDVNHIRFSWMQ